MTRCRNRPDMFSDEQISLIFGNIEEIYQFQRKFAAELETAVNRSSVPETELGKIFLRHVSSTITTMCGTQFKCIFQFTIHSHD